MKIVLFPDFSKPSLGLAYSSSWGTSRPHGKTLAEEPIGNHSLSLFSPYVTFDQHIFEVIEIASRLNLSVVPVLNHNNHYQGLITMNHLIHYFGDLSALKQPGGIIVLEINVNDYSLSEIAQIIEGNDAKILSLYVN